MSEFTLSFGAQYGARHSHKNISPVYHRFRDILPSYMRYGYTDTLSGFVIILRVSGDCADFGGDGPERIVSLKQTNELAIDLVIPEHRWKKVDNEEVKLTVLRGITESYRQLIAKMITRGKSFDQKRFWSDYYQAMCFFLNEEGLPEEETLNIYDPCEVDKTLERFGIPNYADDKPFGG